MIVIVDNETTQSAGEQSAVIGLPNGRCCHVSLAATDYRFDDGRFTVLVDTTWDASHRESLARLVTRVTTVLAQGPGGEQDDLLAVPHFLIAVDRQTGVIHAARDRSGIKTGYHAHTDDRLVIGTLMHEVAGAAGTQRFDQRAAWQLLLTGFTQDGASIYEGVAELRTGEQVTFAGDGAVLRRHAVGLPVDTEEGDGTYEQNVTLLRSHINDAHAELASSERNIVLLSGGIDSAVMLAALAERPVEALSVRVVGTDQDETPYARTSATAVGKPIRILDVDPDREITQDDFARTVMRMNNPYLGVWVFGGLEGGAERTYFAGQDTRLHTPAINIVDRFLFAIGFWKSHLPARLWRGLAGLFLPFAEARQLNRSASQRWRGVYRLLASARPAEFLRHYYLHCEGSFEVYAAMSPQERAAFDPAHSPTLNGISTPRHLYNHLVAANWLTQYTDDMRYMQDLGRLNGTYVAMPFYHPVLTRFSSRIPFNQATRLRFGRSRYGAGHTIINKCLLRDAYRASLSDEVYYRDKATSSQFVLLCRGALGRLVGRVLADDMATAESVVRTFHLETYVNRFLSGDPAVFRDHQYLVTLHYLAALCVYRTTVLAGDRAVRPATGGSTR